MCLKVTIAVAALYRLGFVHPAPKQFRDVALFESKYDL